MGSIWILIFSFASTVALAQSFDDTADREVAAISAPTATPVRAKTFPGGADEEDLKVVSALPEAPVSTDARTLQRVVFKDLYKQELKDERTDPVEE